MFSWFHILMPQEDRFFDYFNGHALTIVEGSKALGALLHGGGAQASQKVMDLEAEADTITQDVLTLTRRSFITPFDRSDIKALITTLDDAIDQMKKTAKTIKLYEVEAFEPQMAAMGDVIIQTARLTADAVGLLKSLRREAHRVNGITECIIKLEESADDLNNHGIKALYLKHKNNNAMDYIVGAEIYNHLERVMDRFEDVANGISGLAIEQS
ncbi:MAG: DUF47 domain-containing protein [Alphaproteobacteria bacterium]|nr:DUF47 domain-containing protein [Alphaproteobacteria bacterium]